MQHTANSFFRHSTNQGDSIGTNQSIRMSTPQAPSGEAEGNVLRWWNSFN